MWWSEWLEKIKEMWWRAALDHSHSPFPRPQPCPATPSPQTSTLDTLLVVFFFSFFFFCVPAVFVPLFSLLVHSFVQLLTHSEVLRRGRWIRGFIYKSCSDVKSQWHPRIFICTQFRSGVVQLQQGRGGCMWITSCVRAGQQEVTRSNVKCMYCNKDVQLKRALVILLEY